jgi:hypothetical protein
MHLCKSCYNCNSRYCYIGKRYTFFIACKLWFDRDLREGNPVAVNLLKILDKEKGRSKEFRRLWHVWMEITNDKTNEINELMRNDI